MTKFNRETFNTPETQYPNPLSMSKEEFENFWDEKLTGFHKNEKFQPGNEELIERLKAAKANNVEYEKYLLSLAPGILDANPENIIDALLGKIYDTVLKSAGKLNYKITKITLIFKFKIFY